MPLKDLPGTSSHTVVTRSKEVSVLQLSALDDASKEGWIVSSQWAVHCQKTKKTPTFHDAINFARNCGLTFVLPAIDLDEIQRWRDDLDKSRNAKTLPRTRRPPVEQNGCAPISSPATPVHATGN